MAKGSTRTSTAAKKPARRSPAKARQEAKAAEQDRLEGAPAPGVDLVARDREEQERQARIERENATGANETEHPVVRQNMDERLAGLPEPGPEGPAEGNEGEIGEKLAPDPAVAAERFAPSEGFDKAGVDLEEQARQARIEADNAEGSGDDEKDLEVDLPQSKTRASAKPKIGQVVHFYSSERRAGLRDGRPRAAIVTEINEDGSAALQVFEGSGTRYVRRVGTAKSNAEYWTPAS